MFRTIDDKAAGSMFQRALAESANEDGTCAESDSAGNLVAGNVCSVYPPNANPFEDAAVLELPQAPHYGYRMVPPAP